MNYIKKHIKWIIIFVVLVVVLVVAILLGGKDEPIKEKETTTEQELNDKENETTKSNGIAIEEEDPWAEDGWSDIIYFD